MNRTLLIRLAAPMQAWGIDSKFDVRYTKTMPTRSGIIGMLAAALGIRRSQPLSFFDDLKIGVREDQKGILESDYQIAQDNRSQKKFNTWVTTRYYLMDALFVVGIEGPSDKVALLNDALQHPFFPLYLGRRSCPLTGQLVLGIRDNNLSEILKQEPWQAAEWYRERILKRTPIGQLKLEIQRDLSLNEPQNDNVVVQITRDAPLSFNQEYRKYGLRKTVIESVPIPEHIDVNDLDIPTNHDAMSLLEDGC